MPNPTVETTKRQRTKTEKRFFCFTDFFDKIDRLCQGLLLLS